MKRILTATIIAIAATTNAANFPKDLEGINHEWQSRASLRLESVCIGNQCSTIMPVSGEPIILGAVLHFGANAIIMQFTEECVWGGEMCSEPVPLPEPYNVIMEWSDDAECYIRIVDTVDGEAEFDAVTMYSGDVGALRIGVFDVRGNGGNFKYSRDYKRQVFELSRWWPKMPPDLGPV